MTSKEEQRQTIEAALNRILALIEQESYKLAEQELQAVDRLIEADEIEFADLRKQYEDSMRAARRGADAQVQQAKALLDDTFRLSIEQFNEAEARDALRHWERNILSGGDTGLWAGYAADVDRRSDEYQEYIEAARVRREVERRWDEAIRQKAAGAAPNAVFEDFYKRAYQTAQEAASAHPDNNLLKILVQEADRRMQQAASVEEISTSAGQLGMFKRALDYIERMHDDDLYPYYKGGDPDAQDGNYAAGQEFVDNFPKNDARTMVLEDANVFARSKSAKYRNEARLLLSQSKPREAQGRLARFDSYNVSEYLSRDDQERLDEAAAQIRQAIEELEGAEKKIDASRSTANTNPLKAWQQYLDGIQAYSGVLHENRTLRIGQEIVARLVETLQNEYKRLELECERDEYDTVITDTRRLINDHQEAIRKAEGIAPVDVDLNLLDAPLRELQTLQEAAQKAKDNRDHVTSTLSEASRLIHDRNLGRATTKITELEEAYRRDYLETFEDYGRVRSELNVYRDAQGELDRLTRLLGHADPLTVEREHENAQKAAQDADPAFTDQFVDVAERLALHLAFLHARRERDQKQFEEARARLVNILNDDRAPDYQDAEALLEEVENALAKVEQINEVLDAARQRMKEGRLDEAYQMLEDHPEPPTRQLRHELAEVRNETERLLLAAIIDELSQITVYTPINRVHVEALLNRLQMDLGMAPAQLTRWRTKLNPYLEAAAAAEAEANRDFEQARERWQRARQLANAHPRDEQEHLERRLAEVDKRILEDRKQTLLSEVREERGVHEAGNSLELRAHLKDVLAEIDRNAHSHARDLDFVIWGIEVLMALIRLSPDTEERRQLFDSAAERAVPYDPEKLPDYEAHIIQRAQVGQRVGKAMKDLENRLNAKNSISDLQDAVTIWDDHQQLCAEEFPFVVSWHNDLLDTVITDLRALTEKRDSDIRLGYLEAYAKLMVLGSALGKPLHNELRAKWQELVPLIDTALRNYPTARGYEDITSPTAKTEQQIADMGNLRHDVGVVRTLLQKFRDTAELNDLALAYEQIAHEKAGRLKDAYEQLKSLRRKYDAAMQYLNSEKGGAGEQQEAAEKLFQDMQVEDVGQAAGAGRARVERGVDFSEHPLTLDLERRIHNIEEGQNNLAERVQRLRHAMQVEDFEIAQKAVGEIELTELRTYDLEGHLRIPDVWGRRECDRWEDVKSTVDLRHRCLERIRDWAAPFDPEAQPTEPAVLPDFNQIKSFRGSETRDERGVDFSQHPLTLDLERRIHNIDEGLYFQGEPEARDERQGSWVVNWDTVSTKVAAEVSAGDFAAARQRIDRALNTSTDRFICLRKALERAERPPIADPPDDNDITYSSLPDVATRYRLARRYAGSLGGDEILKWVEIRRMPEYRDQIQEAEEYKGEIDEIERKWNQFDQQLDAILHKIGALLSKDGSRFDKNGRIPKPKKLKGREKQDICDAARQAQGVLRSMIKLCPDHPRLNQIRNHALLIRVIELCQAE